MVNASPPLVSSFVGLALLLAAAFVFAVHRVTAQPPGSIGGAMRPTALAALAAAAWLAVTYGLAASGFLSFSTRPPTMLVIVGGVVAISIAVGTSELGRRLATGIPLAILVGVQGFRILLEVMMHRAYVEGLMPVQMSFSGFNFDILTGISATVVALVLAFRPGSLLLVRIWNTAGVVLLVNILVIAVVSAPTPIRLFHNEPANEWIAHAPWVWLPAVYVLAAVLGHILVFRRLRMEASVSAPAPARHVVPTVR